MIMMNDANNNYLIIMVLIKRNVRTSRPRMWNSHPHEHDSNILNMYEFFNFSKYNVVGKRRWAKVGEVR